MTTIKNVSFDANNIIVEMNDGEIIQSLIQLYPNLRKGTTEQMNNYEIKGDGRWIHWEELDEDLSAEGFLQNS